MRALVAAASNADDLQNIEEDLDDVDVDVESRDDVHVWVELPRAPAHEHLQVVDEEHREQDGGHNGDHEVVPPACMGEYVAEVHTSTASLLPVGEGYSALLFICLCICVDATKVLNLGCQ